MALFGFKSSKEVEEEKRKAAEAAARQVVQNNMTSLSNLSKGSQVKFVVPYFDVFDPRFMDRGVPVAVHGNIVYSIDNMDLFQQVNKNEVYSDETFQKKLKSQVAMYVKGVVSNAPSDAQIPVVQLERKILEISSMVEQYVVPKVEKLFAVTVRSLEVTSIIIDKESHGYRELKSLTADLEKENTLAKHKVNLSNFNLQNSLNQETLKAQSSLSIDAMQRQQELNLGGQEELQAMQLENQRETMRIQREEMQRASKLQTEQTFMGAHQANLKNEMFTAAVENLSGEAALSMAGMMGTAPAMPSMSQAAPPMPGMASAAPEVAYLVALNGQQAGPFNWQQLQQLKANGQLTAQTYVWAQGMPQWQPAGQVAQLMPLFALAAPPMPGMGGGNAF